MAADLNLQTHQTVSSYLLRCYTLKQSSSLYIQLLPACFTNARNHSGVREFAKTDPTDLELAVDRMYPSADLAATYTPHFELRLTFRFSNPCLCCHGLILLLVLLTL